MSVKMSVEQKIRKEIEAHIYYRSSFKHIQNAFSSEYRRSNKTYTWSAMSMMAQDDLERRIKKIVNLIESK